MPEEIIASTPTVAPVSTPSPASASAAPPSNATSDGGRGNLPSTLVEQPRPSGKVTDVDLSSSKVTFDDFMKVKDGQESDLAKSDAKKSDSPEGAEANDNQADQLAQQEPTEKPSAVTPGKKPIQEILNGRDYSGIDPSDISHFKRMSNEAFAHLKPIYQGYKEAQAKLVERENQIKELSQGKESLPPNYYSHPDAVVLSPNFRQTQQVYDRAKFEENHWAQQLERVESGEPWQDLDMADGKYVTSDPQELTDENRGRVKTTLMRYYLNAKGISDSKMGELQSIAQNFKARNVELTNWVRGQEEKFFPQYKDEKYPGWTYAKELAASLPPELQGDMVLPIAAKMYGIIRLKQDHIAKLTAEQQKKASVAADVAKAGPNGGSFTGAPAGKPPITFDMFEKRKEGSLY